jgi:hypothetical protein
MAQDYGSITPNWRYFTEEELLAEKEPNFYQRIDHAGAFWFGIFCLLGVITNARDHDLFGLSIFSALGGIAFYVAYTSVRNLVEGTICRITIDGSDLGCRVDTGDLEDFLHCGFVGRKIEIERSAHSVRALPAGDYWKQQRRKLDSDMQGPKS